MKKIACICLVLLLFTGIAVSAAGEPLGSDWDETFRASSAASAWGTSGVEYEICNDGKLNEYRYDENGVLRSVVGDVSVEQLYFREPCPLMPGNSIIHSRYANVRLDEKGSLYDWQAYDEGGINQYGPGPILDQNGLVQYDADGTLSVHIWDADGEDRGITVISFNADESHASRIAWYSAGGPAEFHEPEYDEAGHLLKVDYWAEIEEGVRSREMTTVYNWENGVLLGWEKTHTQSGRLVESVSQRWESGMRVWAEHNTISGDGYNTDDFEYLYDEQGRLTEIHRQRITIGGPEERWLFRRDDKGRIVFYAAYRWTGSRVWDTSECWSYEYDESGRLLAAYDRGFNDDSLPAVLAGEPLPPLREDEPGRMGNYNKNDSYCYLRNDDGSLRILYRGTGESQLPVLYTGDWGGTLPPGIDEEELEWYEEALRWHEGEPGWDD